MENSEVTKSKVIYWASGIVSICGIIFEVLFGALGSYILGDGVKQYTLTISLFLTGMGIGASLSERVAKKLIESFIWIEFLIGLLGGFSAFLLFGITAFLSNGTEAFFLYLITLIIGTLTGVELPILIRKANEIGVTLNRSMARVLFSDYAGGLIGGLLFVYLLRPQFGLVKTAFLVGLINVFIAFWVLFMFKNEIKAFKTYLTIGITFIIVLLGGVFWGEETAFSFEQKLYQDPIIHMEETQYQRVVITKEQGDLRLYLNGSLQFSSSDEYRYHETLVHPPMSVVDNPKRILVLGGGDGLAIREIVKYESVEQITLVDLDPRVVELAKTNSDLIKLNKGAFSNPMVRVVHEDAFRFMENAEDFYDVILVDLPDPNNESLNKLYTQEFYSLLRNHIDQNGVIMIQATSPVFAPEVYWTIHHTIESTGLETANFHVDIPSFGNWGFVMASRKPIDVTELEINIPTRFLTTDLLSSLTRFGKDEDQFLEDGNGKPILLEPNTLIRPNLIEKYEKAWLHY